MEKIKKYVERFFKAKKKDRKYNMYLDEMFSLADNARHDVLKTIQTTFDYGYAKGYRAAMAETKQKGGATV